jgi:hypothetical protein
MKATILVLCVLTLIAVAPTHAQDCKLTDTPQTCVDRFIPAFTSAALVAQQEGVVKEDAAKAVTGLTGLASPSESSLKDFLSVLSASLESSMVSEDGNALTFDWNPPLRILGVEDALKLQAFVAESVLNDEVKTRLAENTTALDELNDSLSQGDDTKLSATLQPTSDGYGRSVAPHHDWFQKMLLSVFPDTAQEDDRIDRELDRLRITDPLQRFDQMTDAAGQPLTLAEIGRRITAVEALARNMAATRNTIKTFTDAFTKLLNNQPQLYGSAIFHSRRNVIGQNEWSGKATYEVATQNLNGFRRKYKQCADLESATPVTVKDCATKLQEYAAAAGGGLERVAVGLEYHRAGKRWINDPEAGLAFGFPEKRSFSGSLSFGAFVRQLFPLQTADTGQHAGRIDFTAKYELPEDDESEEKGFVGSLTYTQKISETMSLPLSLVYSDHESDLTNVQKKFSARFGLMYKLPDLK